MDFSFSEEQEALRTELRGFMEKECPESFVREMEEDPQGFSPELWRKLADRGLLGLPYPEKYGGADGSFTDAAILYEEMGRAMLPSPHLSTVILSGLTILEAGSEDQMSDLLPRIARGDLVIALALTEPESSWDGKAWEPEGVTVRATPHGSDFVIDGTKLFVHDAHFADRLLCVVRTKDGSDPEDGVTLFLVDAKDPNVQCEVLDTTAGDKQCEVSLNGVVVSGKDMVGELHSGWAPLSKAMQKGAVLLCAEMVGAGQRVLEITVDYAKNRIQFDMPIGINQYVQEHCVYLLSDLEAARWLTYQAVSKIDQGVPCDMEAAMAKAWTSDSHERVCWRGHQVFAGVGYTVDTGLMPLYSRRAKTKQLYLGDSAFHLEKVASGMETWSAPEKPRAKPLGIFDIPAEKQIPYWQPWNDRWEAIEERKKARGGG